jgi:hypothetical protein
MRAFISVLLLTLLSVASALSNSGVRLLVVLEEASEKALYSQFWADLEGRLRSICEYRTPLTGHNSPWVRAVFSLA